MKKHTISKGIRRLGLATVIGFGSLGTYNLANMVNSAYKVVVARNDQTREQQLEKAYRDFDSAKIPLGVAIFSPFVFGGLASIVESPRSRRKREDDYWIVPM